MKNFNEFSKKKKKKKKKKKSLHTSLSCIKTKVAIKLNFFLFFPPAENRLGAERVHEGHT